MLYRGRGDDVGASLEKLRSGLIKKKKKKVAPSFSPNLKERIRDQLLQFSSGGYRLMFAKGWALRDLV